jgi:hypothetical protein
MKTFYDSREYAPGKEVWKPFEAKVVLTTRSQYLLLVTNASRSKDFDGKYLVIPKDNFIVDHVFVTKSFFKGLIRILFTRHKSKSSFPEDIL